MTGGKSSDDWRAYYSRTIARPPCETLIFALGRFEAEEPAGASRFAVDLGCGNGRDTIELLRRGWRVLAIDAEPEAAKFVASRPDLPADAQLDTLVARFEDAAWPTADLVNSGFALPLCPADRFPGLWQKIVESLHPGGRFSGQLFGDRDDWADDPTITCLTRDRLDALLAGLEVEHFREEEDDSVTPRGKPKHWHIYHLVVRRP